MQSSNPLEKQEFNVCILSPFTMDDTFKQLLSIALSWGEWRENGKKKIEYLQKLTFLSRIRTNEQAAANS